MANSVITPAGVIRPILLAWLSENQRLPSGPSVIRAGWLLAVGTVNSVTVPPGKFNLPILFADCSVNHKLPSGPTVRPSVEAVGELKKLVAPEVVILPIRLALVIVK